MRRKKLAETRCVPISINKISHKKTVKDRESLTEIRVLIFLRMGMRFAIDMDQILEVVKVDQVKGQEINFISIHNVFPFQPKSTRDHASTAILLKFEEEEAVEKNGIIIDELVDIVTIPIADIQPLPTLIESSSRSKAIWGVSFLDEEIFLLFDFYKANTTEVLQNN